MSRCGSNALECQHYRWALGVPPFSPTLILKQKQFFLSQLWAHSCQIFSIVKFLFYLFILYFLLSGFSQSAFGGLVTSECDSSRMKKHKPVVFLPIHSYVQGYSKHAQSKHLSLSDLDIYWEARHILFQYWDHV